MQVFVSKNFRNSNSLVRRRATYHVQVRRLERTIFFVKKDRLYDSPPMIPPQPQLIMQH